MQITHLNISHLTKRKQPDARRACTTFHVIVAEWTWVRPVTFKNIGKLISRERKICRRRECMIFQNKTDNQKHWKVNDKNI